MASKKEGLEGKYSGVNTGFALIDNPEPILSRRAIASVVASMLSLFSAIVSIENDEKIIPLTGDTSLYSRNWKSSIIHTFI